MAKITKAEYEALPAALKGSFEADGDDYVLKTDDGGNLKEALRKERDIREKAEKALKEKEAAEEAEKAKLDEQRLRDEKKFEDIIANRDRSIDELKKQLMEKDEVIAAKETEFSRFEVEQMLTAELGKNQVVPERLTKALRLAKDDIEFERRDGKTVIKVKDGSGEARETPLSDYIAKFKTENDFLFQSTLEQGTGSAGSESHAGTSGRSWAELSRAEKTAAIRAADGDTEAAMKAYK